MTYHHFYVLYISNTSNTFPAIMKVETGSNVTNRINHATWYGALCVASSAEDNLFSRGPGFHEVTS